MQLTITFHADAAPVSGWARQLGWEGGDASTPSWGFEVAQDEFRRLVEAIRSANTALTRFAEPQWFGYWSFPVKDPMGYTVEITTPQLSAWP